MTLSDHGRRGVTLIELMVVVTIVALLAGVSFPALTAGLAGVRLASAAGSVASFLTSSLNIVERHERAAALVIAPKDGRIERFSLAEKPDAVLEMPAGVSIEGDEPRRIVLEPGGTAPRILIALRSEKGGRRTVALDPVTGVPIIRRPAEAVTR